MIRLRRTALRCNPNGIDDAENIAAGTSQDCNTNGVPLECESDADGDAVINACDNYAMVPDAAQEDADGDGPGDACEVQLPEALGSIIEWGSRVVVAQEDLAGLVVIAGRGLHSLALKFDG